MKAVKILIIFSVLSMLFSTCKKDELPPGKYIDISGKIINKKGIPISNVKIIVGETGGISASEPKIDEFTTIVYTDSLGNFSIKHFDRFTKKTGLETDEVVVYNAIHQDCIWFFHDNYRTELHPIYEPNYYSRDTTFMLRGKSHLKLILNPVSAADGISISERYIGHIYESNLYARADGTCRKENPRYAEFNYIVDAETDIKFKWHIYTDGECWGGEDHEKTMGSNPDNKDTLVFQIDY